MRAAGVILKELYTERQRARAGATRVAFFCQLLSGPATTSMSSLMATPPDGTATAALKAEVASLKEQLAAQGEKLSALEATVARLAAAK